MIYYIRTLAASEEDEDEEEELILISVYNMRMIQFTDMVFFSRLFRKTSEDE